jgi:hypothetical protein
MRYRTVRREGPLQRAAFERDARWLDTVPGQKQSSSDAGWTRGVEAGQAPAKKFGHASPISVVPASGPSSPKLQKTGPLHARHSSCFMVCR